VFQTCALPIYGPSCSRAISIAFSTLFKAPSSSSFTCVFKSSNQGRLSSATSSSSSYTLTCSFNQVSGHGYSLLKRYKSRIISPIFSSLLSEQNTSTTLLKDSTASPSRLYASSSNSSVTSCLMRSISISSPIRNPGSISSIYAYCLTTFVQKECSVETCAR